MKWLLRLAFMGFFSLLVNCQAFAQEVTISFDGHTVLNEDVAPEIVNDRVFVPLRFVSENLYISANRVLLSANEQLQLIVDWNDATKTAMVRNKFSHVIGSSYVLLDNGTTADVGVNSYIKDGRTMVSVRLISEALGCKVDWDSKNYKVMITTDIALKLPEGERTQYFKDAGRPGMWEDEAIGPYVKDSMVKGMEGVNFGEFERWNPYPNLKRAQIAYILIACKSYTRFPDELLKEHLTGNILYHLLDYYYIGAFADPEWVVKWQGLGTGDLDNEDVRVPFIGIKGDDYIAAAIYGHYGAYSPLKMASDGKFYDESYEREVTPYLVETDPTSKKAIEDRIKELSPEEYREFEAYKKWFFSVYKG
ncbi:MAG: copper amine oxidase N-terminal domain-containing protein [Clostridiales bacterium]|jgi:hypothetical protein|nr:copper amine oxidase N-terminal domain-containing protein [Clostridiales bacterium]